MFENTTSPVHVHIICDDTIEHGREFLQELCSRHGHSIEFHVIKEIPESLLKADLVRFTIGTLYRLFIHELVDADKVIYVDSDIIFERDILDLHSIDISEHFVAAVYDPCLWSKKRKPRFSYVSKIPSLSYDKYFQAGLLVMNLKKIRELSGDENIFVKRLDEYNQAGIRIKYPDQDILNAVFGEYENGVLYIGKEFNTVLDEDSLVDLDLENSRGKIIHYTVKPYSQLFPAHMAYWKYFARSPWAAEIVEELDKVFKSPKMSVYMELSRHEALIRRMYDYVRFGLGGMLLKRFRKSIK